MPSIILGNTSGGQNILSGSYYSGNLVPIGEVRLKLALTSSGNCYVGLSGGVTANSGTLAASGGASSGLLDGMLMFPGDSYNIPKIGYGRSGQPQLYVVCDAAASGQARLYWQIY